MAHSIREPARRLCRMLLVAGAFILAPAAVSAQQGDSFTGDHFDPVTGYPCINQFCDVVRLPGTDCLCAKQNPSETVLARVRLDCRASGNQTQACTLPPRNGN